MKWVILLVCERWGMRQTTGVKRQQPTSTTHAFRSRNCCGSFWKSTMWQDETVTSGDVPLELFGRFEGIARRWLVSPSWLSESDSFDSFPKYDWPAHTESAVPDRNRQRTKGRRTRSIGAFSRRLVPPTACCWCDVEDQKTKESDLIWAGNQECRGKSFKGWWMNWVRGLCLARDDLQIELDGLSGERKTKIVASFRFESKMLQLDCVIGLEPARIGSRVQFVLSAVFCRTAE